MELKLNSVDRLRISTDGSKNFIDVEGMNAEIGIAVSGYPSFHYIEVRAKRGYVKTFYFKSKDVANEYESTLDWWRDAEIIFSYEK